MLMISNATLSDTTQTPSAMLPGPGALDNTLGPLLLGTFGGVFIFGVTMHQTYRYFHTYPDDGRILKSLVIVVMTIEAFTTGLTIYSCYYYMVQNYFNAAAPTHILWETDVTAVISSITMVLSQSFFVRRLWLVAPHCRPLLILAGALCLAEIGFLTAATAKGFIFPNFIQFKSSQWLVSAGSAAALIADTMLTVLLIIVLRQSRTGIKRTDSMLDMMTLYAVNTGLLSGICNLLTVIFSFAQKNTSLWIAFAIINVKMYSITLLSALNSRKSLAAYRGHIADDTSPFGISGLPERSRLPNVTTSQVHGHRRRPSSLRRGRFPDDSECDSSKGADDSVIELKAVKLGGSTGQDVLASGTTDVVSGKRPAPTAAKDVFVVDIRSDDHQEVLPV